MGLNKRARNMEVIVVPIIMVILYFLWNTFISDISGGSTMSRNKKEFYAREGARELKIDSANNKIEEELKKIGYEDVFIGLNSEYESVVNCMEWKSLFYENQLSIASIIAKCRQEIREEIYPKDPHIRYKENKSSMSFGFKEERRGDYLAEYQDYYNAEDKVFQDTLTFNKYTSCLELPAQ